MNGFSNLQADHEIRQFEKIIRDTPVYTDFTGRIMARLEEQEPAGYGFWTSRRKRLGKSVIMTSAVLAAVIIFLLGGSFISPTMAESIRQIPGMSTLFRLAGDYGLKVADEHNLLTRLSRSDTHNGLTIAVPEVMFDGTRVSIGLESLTDGQVSSLAELIGNVKLKINGEDIKTFLGSESSSISIIIKPEIVKGSAILEFYDQRNQGGSALPDQFNLTLAMDISGFQEPFTIEIPVEKNTRDNLIVTPDSTRSYEGLAFTVQKIELTPVTTNITTRIELAEHSLFTLRELTLGYDIIDDQGHSLKQIMGHGSYPANEHSLVSDFIFEPFAGISETITIKPYVHLYQDRKSGQFQLDAAGFPKIEYIPELEITLPIEK